ncbi:DnaD and phage-associated domain-containing protein [Alkalibacterium subtropicum]|uniref:DnaD and phage-associated domain-containing protein n=1 Tax=Alkalibacterium subtropicum TaxID=753702 RepID=A0A1I1EZE8_9LACT|nr:DnaD domain protein [Alkalibacterium subtropicum]SFB90283.1 DnaD and phage-associated domain-containing protein [Alkalibacterium subtropicum]
MNNGYIKFYRKITKSFVWTDPYTFKLWTLCLLKAAHKDNKFLFNGEEITVNSGQFVTGRAAITKELNEGAKSEHRMTEASVWRRLKKFEKEEMLNIDSTTKYSVITIKNWHDYQVSEQQVNSDRTATEQRVNTNKNEKNLKNEKNYINNNTPARFYESNGYGSIASLTIQKIDGWVEDISKTGTSEEEANEIIIKAMEFGVVHNKRTWSYVNRILVNWENRGLNTLEKIEAAEAERNAKQETKPAKKKSWNKNTHTRSESLPKWARDGYEPVKDTPLSADEKEEMQRRIAEFRAMKPGKG